MKKFILFGTECSFCIGQKFLILSAISLVVLALSWIKFPECAIGTPDIAIPLIIFGFGYNETNKKTRLAISSFLLTCALFISACRLSSAAHIAMLEKIYGYITVSAAVLYFASMFTLRYSKGKMKKKTSYLLNLNEDNILEEAISSYGKAEKDSLYRPAANIEGMHKDLYLRLLEYFDNEKPYLRWDLSIYDVARALYTNKVYISKAISIYTGSNFCQFVNYYRIKYSMELFSNETTLKISDLSARSGFKSTTSFLTSFKSFLHRNPSDWMKEVRKTNVEKALMRHTHP